MHALLLSVPEMEGIIIYATRSEGMGACIILEDKSLVEFMYFVFTRMPGESYRRRLRSLLLFV